MIYQTGTRAQIHEFNLGRLRKGILSSRHSFKLWLFIIGMDVGSKTKISAQYLQN